MIHNKVLNDFQKCFSFLFSFSILDLSNLILFFAFSFSDSINKVMKESFSYTLTWPNRQGSIREIAIDAESMSDESSSTLSDQIEYSIQEGWGLSHHFTGLDSAWGEVNLTQEYADDFGVITREWNNLPIRDSMAPVLVSSEIVWREDDANKDELVITFSEKLDTNITNVDQLFNFVVGTCALSG